MSRQILDIPLKVGGSDGIDNLLTLCKACHVIEESKLRPPVESIPKKMYGEMWPIHYSGACMFFQIEHMVINTNLPF